MYLILNCCIYSEPPLWWHQTCFTKSLHSRSCKFGNDFAFDILKLFFSLSIFCNSSGTVRDANLTSTTLYCLMNKTEYFVQATGRSIRTGSVPFYENKKLQTKKLKNNRNYSDNFQMLEWFQLPMRVTPSCLNCSINIGWRFRAIFYLKAFWVGNFIKWIIFYEGFR